MSERISSGGRLRVTANRQNQYVCAVWQAGMLTDSIGSLSHICYDLHRAISEQDVHGNIELWGRRGGVEKGFFVGDTSRLPMLGWTKLAIL